MFVLWFWILSSELFFKKITLFIVGKPIQCENWFSLTTLISRVDFGTRFVDKHFPYNIFSKESFVIVCDDYCLATLDIIHFWWPCPFQISHWPNHLTYFSSRQMLNVVARIFYCFGFCFFKGGPSNDQFVIHLFDNFVYKLWTPKLAADWLILGITYLDLQDI